MKNKLISLKNIILLQLVVIVYTVSSILAKFASVEEVFSMRFCLFYAAEILVLGIYALLWQQMIKKFDLSVAYANRAMALLWSAVWAILIFREKLFMKQWIGIAFVVAGTMIVNSIGREKK